MLERRGFSKKINYRLLESLYGEDAEGEEGEEGATKLMKMGAKPKSERALSSVAGRSTRSHSRTGSRSRSRSHSVVSHRSTSIEPDGSPRTLIHAAAGAAKRTRLLSNASNAKPVSFPTAAGPSSNSTTSATLAEGSVSQPRQAEQQTAETKPSADQRGPENEDNEDFDDDDDEDDDMEDEEGDGVDAAFAGSYGDYYDEGSDYGSD